MWAGIFKPLLYIILILIIWEFISRIFHVYDDSKTKKSNTKDSSNHRTTFSDNASSHTMQITSTTTTNNNQQTIQKVASPEVVSMKKRILEKYNTVSESSHETIANVGGHEIRYIDRTHTYFVDGKKVPSVTEIIKKNGFNPSSYDTIDPAVLQRAALKGTHMHNIIEKYEEYGTESHEPELFGYKKLKRENNIKPVISELLLAIFDDNNKPVCAGRLDFVTYNDNDSVNIIDLKRTSQYHADTVSRQLNLYRIGFMQCFDIAVNNLACLRLRDYVAEYHKVIISKQKAFEVLFKETNNPSFNLEKSINTKPQQNIDSDNSTDNKFVSEMKTSGRMYYLTAAVNYKVMMTRAALEKIAQTYYSKPIQEIELAKELISLAVYLFINVVCDSKDEFAFLFNFTTGTFKIKTDKDKLDIFSQAQCYRRIEIRSEDDYLKQLAKEACKRIELLLKNGKPQAYGYKSQSKAMYGNNAIRNEINDFIYYYIQKAEDFTIGRKK